MHDGAQRLFPRLGAPGESRALTVGEKTLSWSQLAAAVGGARRDLRESGVREADVVAVVAEPNISALVAMVAVMETGAVLLPLNPKSGSKERDHIIADARPVRVLSDAQLRFSSEAEVFDRRADERPLLILYTSGTTGSPKGAVLTAGNIAHNLDGLAEAWQWSDRDTVVHALPLFHVHGLVLGFFGSLRVGGALHWVGRFDVGALCRALECESGMLFGVPTMYSRIAAAADSDAAVRDRLAQARLLVSGSAGLPKSVHERFSALGLPVRERYGLTETLINTAARGDEPPAVGSVGRPIRGTELELVDDTGVVITANDEIGEVMVRGPSVFAGYLNRPDATSAVLSKDGWFRTGDMASRENDGTLRIVGRKATDLIKSGGYKIGAGEVESCLLDHVAVAEAAVVGVADDELGQRITAFVVCEERPGETLAAELEQWVAKQLAPHKRPRQVHFVESLPRNAMGKLQKGALTSP